jgi:beta-galactosidase beta subunit
MEFIYFFIIIILIVILYKYNEGKTYDVVYIKSSLNNKSYLVRNLPDKQNAANTLAQINQRFDKLIEFLKTSDLNTLYKAHVIKSPSLDLNKIPEKQKKELEKFKTDINRLISNYNTNSLSENTPNSAYTAYSENKGQKIVFCIRNKQTNEIIKLNTLMFVALHEFSHLMTKSIGHTPEFWDNFKIILRISIRIGIYDCQNFEQKAEKYCGTKITDSPLKCNDI